MVTGRKHLLVRRLLHLRFRSLKFQVPTRPLNLPKEVTGSTTTGNKGRLNPVAITIIPRISEINILYNKAIYPLNLLNR